jgi:hypothetical protein
MLLIPSRKSNDPDVPDKEKSDVTVMIYGAGGGSLDRSMIGKFRQLYRADAEAYKHVQIAVQFKFSDDDRMPNWRSEEEQKTFLKTRGNRLTIIASNNKIQTYEKVFYMDARMHPCHERYGTIAGLSCGRQIHDGRQDDEQT